MTKSRSKNNPRHVWTDADLQLLRADYPDRPAHEIAAALGLGLHQVYARAHALGLEKSQAFKDANKGLRRPGFCVGRMSETQFKKGRPAHESRNYVPIGTEKIDPKRGVLMRKVTDDPSLFPAARWRPVHVLVWEAVNGPVLPRHMCIFRPGMKTFVAAEITLDRLEVVTFEQNMKRNTVHNLPAPLPELILLRGALNRKINRKVRNEEQNGRSAESSIRSARGTSGQRQPVGHRTGESDQ